MKVNAPKNYVFCPQAAASGSSKLTARSMSKSFKQRAASITPATLARYFPQGQALSKIDLAQKLDTILEKYNSINPAHGMAKHKAFINYLQGEYQDLYRQLRIHGWFSRKFTFKKNLTAILCERLNYLKFKLQLPAAVNADMLMATASCHDNAISFVITTAKHQLTFKHDQNVYTELATAVATQQVEYFYRQSAADSISATLVAAGDLNPPRRAKLSISLSPALNFHGHIRHYDYAKHILSGVDFDYTTSDFHISAERFSLLADNSLQLSGVVSVLDYTFAATLAVNFVIMPPYAYISAAYAQQKIKLFATAAVPVLIPSGYCLTLPTLELSALLNAAPPEANDSEEEKQASVAEFNALFEPQAKIRLNTRHTAEHQQRWQYDRQQIETFVRHYLALRPQEQINCSSFMLQLDLKSRLLRQVRNSAGKVIYQPRKSTADGYILKFKVCEAVDKDTNSNIFCKFTSADQISDYFIIEQKLEFINEDSKPCGAFKSASTKVITGMLSHKPYRVLRQHLTTLDSEALSWQLIQQNSPEYFYATATGKRLLAVIEDFGLNSFKAQFEVLAPLPSPQEIIIKQANRVNYVALYLVADAGTPLDEYARDLPLSAFHSSLAGLAILHDNDLVLNDVKPSNMAWDEETQQVNNFDFESTLDLRELKDNAARCLRCFKFGTPIYNPPAFRALDEHIAQANIGIEQMQKACFKTKDAHAYLVAILEVCSTKAAQIIHDYRDSVDDDPRKLSAAAAHGQHAKVLRAALRAFMAEEVFKPIAVAIREQVGKELSGLIDNPVGYALEHYKTAKNEALQERHLITVLAPLMHQITNLEEEKE